MKGIIGYLVAAIVLAGAGMACLAAGYLDRDMAHAEQSVMALKYDDADKTFATTERYYDYASRLPWIGDDALNDVRTRRAELKYWQGQFAAISTPPQESRATATQNIGLELVAANAGYRAGRLQAKD